LAAKPNVRVRRVYDPPDDQARFPEFTRRCRVERERSDRSTVSPHLRDLAAGGRLTLLIGAKAADISEAKVLADVLGG